LEKIRKIVWKEKIPESISGIYSGECSISF